MTVIDLRRARIATTIAKLRAYHEIQNEMGRAIAALNYRQPDTLLSYFALDRADVSLEYADEGVFTGREAVNAIVEELIGSPPQPGEMIDLQLTTPIIEVADDLESARGLWWSPGAGSECVAERPAEARWIWGMIAVDLVPAEGGWKILHGHYFRFIKCSYEKGWVDDLSMINRPQKPMHPLSSPTTYHNPYSPLSIRDGIPAAPRPYKSYDGFGWRLSKDKTL